MPPTQYHNTLRLIAKVIDNLKQSGVKLTAYKIYYTLYGLLFDIQHGTDTTLTSTIAEHGFSANYGTGNFPAHPGLLRRAFKQMDVRQTDVILDIGCGKGRALLVAAEFPFQHLIGIDIVEENVRTASKNMAKAGVSNAEILHIDALQEPLPIASIWLFFKPFHESHLYRLLRFARHQPRMLLLVNTPVDDIDGFELLFHYQHPIYPNFRYLLFRNKESV